MADEESEVRRMAEIADAINAILDADPNGVGDTPSQPAAPQQASQIAPEQTASNQAVSQDPMANELDAAIAAEFAGGTSESNDAAQAEMPPMPESNNEPNHAIGQEVRQESEMADLSMRMQDTLAEIRSQANAAWVGADDLLAEMEGARAALVTDLRGQIAHLEQETQKRRQQVMEQLEQLESQSLMVRDEMEMMLVKYEASLSDLHKRYFDNAQIERDRLNRYREFLQFLLDERTM